MSKRTGTEGTLILVCALVAGCQVPYGPGRHDLVGDRIVAISASPAGGAAGDAIEMRALLLEDGHLWHEAPLELSWGFVDPNQPEAAEDFDPGAAIAFGPRPSLTLPEGDTARVALAATFPSGTTLRGYLDLPVGAPSSPITLDAFSVVRVDALSVEALGTGDLPAESLDLAARRELTSAPGAIAPGDFARLTIAAPDATRVRWMSTAGQTGTFYELDDRATDWAAGHILRDDEDIEEATPIAPGPQTFIALVVDDAGSVAWRAQDLAIGELDAQLIVGGRFMGPASEASGLVRGTLVADDTLPAGVRLEEPEPVAASDLDPLDPYGTAAWTCAESGSDGATLPFDPEWLMTGCSRADVTGSTVVVRVGP